MKSFSEIEQYLTKFMPGSISDGGVYTLDRMRKIMPLLGSPQEKLQIIHIAGTSGKTSTAYYVTEMLRSSDVRVGLSVSPHIYMLNERVQVNGTPLDEQEFCQLFNRFINIDGVLELSPTYFELLVAFAYWCFVENGCTHAVVEVGLGGLLDGTNIVKNPDKVAVITDIGLDHTRILGNSVKQIAIQKAGIILPGNHVFMLRQNPVAEKVALGTASLQHATLNLLDQKRLQENTEFADDLPNYQKRNWLLAREVTNFVAQLGSLRSLTEQEMRQTQTIQVPARMQTLELDGRKLILDGAHNPQKLTALIDSLKDLYPNASISALVSFGAAKSEALAQNLRIISEVTDEVIITEFTLVEDFAHKSVDVAELRHAAESAGIKTLQEQPDPTLAFDLLLQQKADILLVTGSFYLISVLQKKIKDLQT